MKIIIIALMVIFFSAPAFAVGSCQVSIPKGCDLQSSEFSTGGAETMWHYIEVDCRFPDGRYVKYLDSVGSLTGFLGFGRIAIPSKITFKEWDNDRIKLDC